ncbi:HipA N-terminal domain-containing protein [Pseudomonas sp. LB1P83]
MSSAFVIWQDPETTMWEPVAKLKVSSGVFKFSYTRGALNKRFVAFPRMELKNKEYTSSELFPFFQNRLIPERRPEYHTMMSWLDMAPGTNDPLEVLSASGGAKKTDNFRIVKAPEKSLEGEYRLKFFVSGIAYLSNEAKNEVLSFDSRTRLYCSVQANNPADPNAIAIVKKEGLQSFGYYPRYLNEDLIRLNQMCGVVSGEELLTRIEVVRVNASAPEQYRLLCESITPWPEGFEPFQTEKYKLLAEGY